MSGSGMIVEDLPAVRGWLIEVCGRVFPEVAMEACGDLASAMACLRGMHEQGRRLDFVLVDIGLPDGSGIDLIRDLKRRYPNSLPVVTTIYGDDRNLFDAIAAGAQGYLLKSDDPEGFEGSLLRIKRGEPPLSPAVARRMMAHFRAVGSPTSVSLSQRETQVLSLLALGMRIQDIARDITISEHTVRDHVKAIYSKLNISSRAEAAIEAARRGLV